PVIDTGTAVLLFVQNKVEAAHPVAMGDIQRQQTATAERFLQCDPGQAANAKASFDSAFDSFCMLQLQANFQLWQQAINRAVKALTSTGAGLTQNPVSADQILVSQRRSAGQRMGGSTEQAELVVTPGNYSQCIILQLPLDQAYIQLE